MRVAKVWSDELGRYGEPRGDTVIGVSSEDVTVQTRVHTWRIELSIDAQGAPRLSTGKSDVGRYHRVRPGSPCQARGALRMIEGSLPPWSSVNNCTVDSIQEN